jgi:hypothetical protein
MVREAVPLHCLLVGMVLSLELAALRRMCGKPEAFRTSDGRAERVIGDAAAIG